MTVRTPVDCQALVAQFLLDHPDVQAVVDDRVYRVIPGKPPPEFPLLRIHQFTSQSITKKAVHLVGYQLQIDAFGGPQAQATDAAFAAYAALHELAGVYDLGVVTGVDLSGIDYTPDETWDPARPHCRFDLTVWAHPGPDLGS